MVGVQVKLLAFQILPEILYPQDTCQQLAVLVLYLPCAGFRLLLPAACASTTSSSEQELGIAEVVAAPFIMQKVSLLPKGREMANDEDKNSLLSSSTLKGQT